MAEPVFNLDAFVEPQTVRINGAEYDLVAPEELSLLDHSRLDAWVKRLTALADGGSGAAVEGQEILRRCVRLILRAPADVLASLRDVHRLQILRAWSLPRNPEEDARRARPQPEVAPPDWGEQLPRLVRFYGGTPLAWLSETPVAVLRAHVVMLDRMTAEECVRAATVHNVRIRDVSRAWGLWRKASQPAGATRPAGPADLAAMGIKARVVPKRDRPREGGAHAGR